MLVSKTCCFPDVLLPDNKMIDLSKSGDTVKLFNTLSGLYGFAIRALESLEQGELTAFDSLATDCSCHLRALRIAAIAKEILSTESDLKSQLATTLQTLKKQQKILKSVEADLVPWCQKGKKMTGNLAPIISAIQALQEDKKSSDYCFSIQDVLQKLQVKSDINLDFTYLIHAYILTLVKSYKAVQESEKIICADKACSKTLDFHDQVFKEVTVPKQLSECMKKWENNNIYGNLLEKDIYRLAKKHLADLSVQFLLDETQKLKNQHTYSLLSISKKMVEDKVEIPDFYSLTGAFQVGLQKQIPVLLKIKKCLHAHRHQEPQTPFDVVLYLAPQGEKFELQPFSSQLKNGPFIVVEAKRSGKIVEKESTEDYTKRLLTNFDFIHLCALDGAQHKQYTSDDNSMQQKPSEVIAILQMKEYEQEAKRLDALKQEAEEKGCAFNNQSLIILSHIFADMLDKHTKDVNPFPKTGEAS